MKKFNIILGIILAVAGILTGLAWYFNVVPTLALVITALIGVVVIFVATMQYFHHQEYDDYNPVQFWFIYSIIGAVITLIPFFLLAAPSILNQNTATCIMMGTSFTVLPIFGIFFGMIGKSFSGNY